MKKILLSFLVVLTMPVHAQENLPADKIMQLVNDREDGVTRQQDMQMVLISKTGKQRVRQVEAFSKDYPNIVKSKLKFTAPVSMKNTAMLIVDEVNKSVDDQWVYIPALNSVKKIAAGDQKSNFFGSDLIYADLTKRRIADYKYERLKNKTYKGKSLYHIVAKPDAQESKITGYKKIVYLINPINYLPMKTVFYLNNGDNKVAEINEVLTVKSIDFPKKTTIVTLKNGALHHKSIFIYKNIKVNEDISDAVFTRENFKS